MTQSSEQPRTSERGPKYAFMDWSGDVGFKFDEGSSEYLVFALVSVTDYPALRQALCDLREARGLPRNYEFHYTHVSRGTRRAFFAAVRQVPFEAVVLVVPKREIPRSLARRNRYARYEHFVAELAAWASVASFKDAIVYVDARSTRNEIVRAVRRGISAACRARGAQRGPRKVRGKPAHAEDGLQLADMIASAVAEREEGGQGYLRGLKERIGVIRYSGA